MAVFCSDFTKKDEGVCFKKPSYSQEKEKRGSGESSSTFRQKGDALKGNNTAIYNKGSHVARKKSRRTGKGARRRANRKLHCREKKHKKKKARLKSYRVNVRDYGPHLKGKGKVARGCNF